jgi:outer membrane murein-binding lipoprotein Lpp
MSHELSQSMLLLSTQLLAARESCEKIIEAQAANEKQVQGQKTELSAIQGEINIAKTALHDAKQVTNQVESRIGGLSAEKAQLEKDVSGLERKIESKNKELKAAKSELNEVKQETKDAKKVAGEVDLSLQKLTKYITAAKNELEVQMKPSKKRDLEEEAADNRETSKARTDCIENPTQRLVLEVIGIKEKNIQLQEIGAAGDTNMQTEPAQPKAKLPKATLLEIDCNSSTAMAMMTTTAESYFRTITHESFPSFSEIWNDMLKDENFSQTEQEVWKNSIRVWCKEFPNTKKTTAAQVVAFVKNKKITLQRAPYKKLSSLVIEMVEQMKTEDREILKKDDLKHENPKFHNLVLEAKKNTNMVVDLPDDILIWIFNTSMKPKRISGKSDDIPGKSKGKKTMCKTTKTQPPIDKADAETESDDDE